MRQLFQILSRSLSFRSLQVLLFSFIKRRLPQLDCWHEIISETNYLWPRSSQLLVNVEIADEYDLGSYHFDHCLVLSHSLDVIIFHLILLISFQSEVSTWLWPLTSNLVIVAARFTWDEIKELPRWASRQHLPTHLLETFIQIKIDFN